MFSARINKGLIFCQVDKIKVAGHEVWAITDGNQLWKGAAPIFISIATIKHEENRKDIVIGPIRNTREAKAWIKKYFIALRIDSGFNEVIIIGINKMVLTSNLSHI